jgi:uncharacterized protein YndB with AHSA1/START domain
VAGGDRVLEVTRVFAAPRRLLFQVWIEPGHLVRWWGPRGFTMPSHSIDVRPGGAYRFCMRSPDGGLHWLRGVYREIVEPERLVFTYAWEDAAGAPRHETLVTVRFAELGDRTQLTLRQELFESVTARDLHREGWASNLDRLADYLAADAAMQQERIG